MPFARAEFSAPELAEQLAAERRGRPFLLYRDAGRRQRLLVMEAERISVGREAGNDLQLNWDAEASRVHALLERVGRSWTVTDDQLSRNGTFVNGTRVQGRRRLSDRDVIRFGSTAVYYRDPAERPADTAPPAGQGLGDAHMTLAQRRVLVALCGPMLDDAGAPSSNRQIADDLMISVEAVRSHMKKLFRLFDVPDLPQNRKRADLARRALEAGVVLPRDLSR